METILKIDNIEKYYGNKSNMTKAISSTSSGERSWDLYFRISTFLTHSRRMRMLRWHFQYRMCLQNR